jgi:hypothetical protein
LAEGVVDFVGPGVEQVLSLEIDFSAAEFFGPAFSEVERGGAANIIAKKTVELSLESRVLAGSVVVVCKVGEGGHEGLWHEHASETAKVAVGVWHDGEGQGGGAHGRFGQRFERNPNHTQTCLEAK